MSERQFYLQEHGRIIGPLSEEQVQKMRTEQLLAPDAAISADAITWQAAEVFFADPAAPVPVEKTAFGAGGVSVPAVGKNAGAPVVPSAEDMPVIDFERPAPPVDVKTAAPTVAGATLGFYWNAARSFRYLASVGPDVLKKRLPGAWLVVLALLLLQGAIGFAALRFFATPYIVSVALTASCVAGGSLLIFMLINTGVAALMPQRDFVKLSYVFLMELLVSSTVFFLAALPLFALWETGFSLLPVWLVATVCFFSAAVFVPGLLNLWCGFGEGAKNFCGLDSSTACVLQILIVLQHFILLPTAYLAFGWIDRFL